MTIAGSDPSGGAGIQADLKTFSALGVYGASAVTAVTVQNTVVVKYVHPLPPEAVYDQIAAVMEDIRPDAVKIGMVNDAGTLDAIVRALETYRPRHVVVDPVMVSTSGCALMQADALRTMKERLLPLADIVTPNLPEAFALAGSEDMPGPDMILIPEVPFDKERFLSRADELYRKKGGVSVVASEGLSYSDGTPIVDPVFTVGRSVYFGDVSSKLSQLITRELGIKSRSEKPGLLSRASIAWQSGRDREEAFACGYASASAALEGRSSVMSIIERTGSSPYSSRIAIRDIEDTILEERRLSEDMYDRDSFTVTDSFRSYLEPMMDSRGARFTAFA